MMNKKIVLFLCFMLTSLFVRAQVSVNVKIDSSAIFIGEQAHIDLKVTAGVKDNVAMPVLAGKMLTKGIEVLKEETLAVEKLNDGRQTAVTKRFTITSFDSANYYIPPFKVEVNGKEYKSNNLALKVETLNVDTLHVDRFFGPKGIMDVPFSWKDWQGVFLLTLLLLVLLAFAGYIALQLHNNRPILRHIRLRPILPPHLWAIKEIEKINKEKAVVEDSKQYYSELTDVLRSYIQKRYGFNAREMTSGEIIERLTANQDEEMLRELQELFYTADLAKFAKLQTQLNENDQNLLRAMNFINATKAEEQETPVPKKIVPVEVKRSDRRRFAFKIVVAVALLFAAIVLFFIGYSVYNMIF